MKRRIGWWDKEPVKAAEILLLVKDPEITYDVIGDQYGLDKSAVAKFARMNGINRLPRRTQQSVQQLKKTRLKDPSNLNKIIDEIDEVQRQMQTFNIRLRELQEQKEALSIHFEYDGANILVYGITDVPLRAAPADWMRFLRLSGAAKLREYITTKFKDLPA